MENRQRLRGSWRLRQGGTIAGAVLVMAGAGLPWSHVRNDISPFHLSLKWLIGPGAGSDADPVKSVGMLLLVVVGLIVFGLVTPGRGTTIVAGTAAILIAAAFLVSVSRSSEGLGVLRVGVYLTIAGGLVAIAGTLLGAGPHHRR